MMNPSHIEPDVALRDFLKNKISVGSGTNPPKVAVYSDWERPTNNLPEDFIVVYINGNISGVGIETPYANGFIMVTLYSKMNDDGSVKKSRVKKILEQFDTLVEGLITGDYHYGYDSYRYITPTAPNQSTGYSITTLNLRWSTISSFNKPKTT